MGLGLDVWPMIMLVQLVPMSFVAKLAGAMGTNLIIALSRLNLRVPPWEPATVAPHPP